MCKFNFLADVSLSMPHTGLFSQNYCFLLLHSFFAGETTIAKKTVERTTFPNGTFSYEVEMFVTPAILVGPNCHSSTVIIIILCEWVQEKGPLRFLRKKRFGSEHTGVIIYFLARIDPNIW